MIYQGGRLCRKRKIEYNIDLMEVTHLTLNTSPDDMIEYLSINNIHSAIENSKSTKYYSGLNEMKIIPIKSISFF